MILKSLFKGRQKNQEIHKQKYMKTNSTNVENFIFLPNRIIEWSSLYLNNYLESRKDM